MFNLTLKKYSTTISYWLFISLLGLASIVSAESVLIKNVSIISGEQPKVSRPSNVYIVDGRIKSISSSNSLRADVELDAKGQYLIPGLIDSHVHLEGIPGYKFEGKGDDPNEAMIQRAKRQLPRSYLYFGFTTLLDIASSQSLVEQWNAHEYAPEVHFCIPVVIPNGYPLAWQENKEAQFREEVAQYMLFDERQAEVYPKSFNKSTHTPEAIVKRIKSVGGKCVKVFYETGFGPQKNLPVPTVNMVKMLVRYAHKLNMPVFLHGNSEASYRFALKVGVDAMAHGMWHWSSLKEDNAKAVSAFSEQFYTRGISIQPTMQVLYGEHELFNENYFASAKVRNAIPEDLINWYQSVQGQWMKSIFKRGFPDNFKTEEEYYQALKTDYKTPLDNVYRMTRSLAKHNATLLFGSDTPSGPFYTQFPGINGHLEMNRWVEAGLPLALLFEALTINNAKILGLDSSVGSIEVGKKANLLLLKENPLLSISAYDSIQKIVLNGKVLERDLFSATLSIKKY